MWFVEQLILYLLKKKGKLIRYILSAYALNIILIRFVLLMSYIFVQVDSHWEHILRVLHINTSNSEVNNNIVFFLYN